MEKVTVHWIDSKYSSGEWLTVEEAKSLDVGDCITRGFLIFEDKNKVTIAQNHNVECGTFHNLMIIPKGSIRELKKE